MTEHELEALLERSSERGAQRALEKVGLHDDLAGNDIRELRGLLDSWRDTKKTVIQTVAKTFTTFILGVIAAGAFWTWWPNK
jgi:Family of unknown function (DUF6127)